MTTMWKTLHQLAAPPRLYQICGRLVPWLAAARHHCAGHGLGPGLWFRPGGLPAGGGLPHYVPACPGGHLVDGYLCGDGGGGVHPGLVWQMKMASLAVAAMAAGGGGVHPFIALVTGAAWGKPMWGTWWVWDARLTSELVLLFLYAGVIALWHAFDDRKMAGRAAGILVLVGVVNLPVIHYSVEWWNTPAPGLDADAAEYRPGDALAAALGHRRYLLLFMTLSLMRMRNLILLMEKPPPVGERTDTEKGAPVSPAFSSWSDFFAMGGYAFFCLAGGGDDRGAAGAAGAAHGAAAPGHSARRGAAAGARGADACRTGATGGRVNLRRKNRLWVVCAVLAGLGLTTALVLYALRREYRPVLYPRRNPLRQARDAAAARRRASACASAGW
ncbi:heme exporter protein C [Salmonella enterica subsp. enterica]|nr:heme exporter protein C [Salmonella enterica subsp. enterica]